MVDCVQHVPCDTAEGFLARLRINSRESPIEGASPYQWIFRGQANSSWSLLPSAIRPGTRLGFRTDRKSYVSKGCGANIEQANGEYFAIQQFAELADRVGLSVPGLGGLAQYQPFAFDDVIVGAQIGTAEWPPAELLELLAIAQHHGVPTRLLDFTFNPLAALFFACADAAPSEGSDETKTPESLAVWALNLNWIWRQPYQFRVVEVQRSSNRFLNAQKGLFVLDKRVASYGDDVPSPCLETRIRGLLEKGCTRPVLVRFTLPRTEVVEALRLLALENVDRAHLMPSLDNVVAALRMSP